MRSRYTDARSASKTSGITASSAGTANKNPSIPWSTRNKSESSKTSKPPPPPSPSASIILVSPTNKILLLHRVQTSSSFPSAHVFPGGNLEPSDGALASSPTDPLRHQDNITYRTGAIRELFEESGILLARQDESQSSPLLNLSPETRHEGRHKIHSNKITIRSWLSQQSSSAVLDTDALIPFTRWITPTNVPKRFTTQMYIYFLPISAKDNDSLIATSDEVETMAPEWRSATEWLDRARSGEIILFPPQFILLSFVADHLDSLSTDTSTSQPSNIALETRRDSLRYFVLNDGNPPWCDKVISPTGLNFTRKDGRAILGLDKPGPELKDAEGVRGDDTRVVLVRFSKAGPREVEVRWRKEVLEEERREREAGAGDEKSKL